MKKSILGRSMRSISETASAESWRSQLCSGLDVGEPWSRVLSYWNGRRPILLVGGDQVGSLKIESQKLEKVFTVLRLTLPNCLYNTFQFAHAYARGEGMKHYTEMVQEPEFAARDKGYTFVSHQQEVGVGYFDDVTTVIQGGSSSVKALTGSTEEEQFH